MGRLLDYFYRTEYTDLRKRVSDSTEYLRSRSSVWVRTQRRVPPWAECVDRVQDRTGRVARVRHSFTLHSNLAGCDNGGPRPVDGELTEETVLRVT